MGRSLMPAGDDKYVLRTELFGQVVHPPLGELAWRVQRAHRGIDLSGEWPIANHHVYPSVERRSGPDGLNKEKRVLLRYKTPRPNHASLVGPP